MKSLKSIAVRQARKKNRRPRRRRLRLESLESRELLAVDAFLVDTAVDENDGIGVGTGTSLREAIIAANADPTRRYQYHLNGDPDPTIVNPAHLPHDRASQVCVPQALAQ